MAKAVIADRREASFELLNPIRKKELILVNSQNINREIKLSDSTRPSIAAMNMLKYP